MIEKNINPLEFMPFVMPNCCEKVQRHAAVFLSIDVYEDKPDYRKPPQWYGRTWNLKHHAESIQLVFFCPFCGEKLPRVIPSGIPGKFISRVTDGGYYCDTCKGRLRECKCLPPEFAWKPNGSVLRLEIDPIDHVHRQKCCPKHGCAFKDRNCPVVKGILKTAYCEKCDNEGL